MKDQKIIIAGGSGFIGTELANWFGEKNEVIILSRQSKQQNNSYKETADLKHGTIRTVYWDGKTIGAWAQELDGADLLINLAGKSVNCRYNAANKKAIFDSRSFSTTILGEAVRSCAHPPRLWINAASATIYRHAEDRPQDEATGEFHNDFSVQVCKLWEKTFFDQQTPHTRKIALRIAITLGAGGVMIPYLNLVKFGLGGRQGNGKQMFSWVHIADVCKTIEWCHEHQEMEGVYNCSSPEPVTNKEFMQQLRRAAHHRIGLPAPAWMLKMGAAVIGTEPELILKSRWVLPTRLLGTNFQFQYPSLKSAFATVIQQLPRKQYHLF